ncbi:MAG: DUF2207 domain-containing protein [Candidatus Nanopelagicales bacterium]
MSGKRVFFLVLLVVGALIGLLHPLVTGSSSSGTVSEVTTISKYTGDIQVAADGNMTATETIAVNFPVARHGIFRYFDVQDPSDPHVRYIPTIKSITMDGAAAQYSTSWEKGKQFYVAKIGDPDALLNTGTHTYVISYSIPGVISPTSAGKDKTFATTMGTAATPPQSVFFWNVIANGWQMTIKQADVQISLPAASEQVQCSAGTGTGANAAAGPCKVTGAGTQTLNVSAAGIPPFTGMTVRAGLPTPAPARTTVPWSVAWDPILGRNLPVVIIVVLLTGVGLVVGFLWARKSKEDEPGFPVMYAPPEGLGPPQVVYMASEETGKHALAATLFYLADKRLVTLEQRGDKSWLVTGAGTPEMWNGIDGTTIAVATKLGVTAPGYWFLADRTKASGEVLAGAKSEIGSATKNWAKSGGFVKTSGIELLGKALWFAAFVLAIVGFIGFVGPTMLGLPFAGFAIGGFGLLATGVGTRRTDTGRDLWSRSVGFERLLSTPSSQDRFDFAANKDLFISYIPFAVAFGVADKWAEKYRMYTNSEPPLPFWYPYGYGVWGNPYDAGGSFGSDFDSTLSASISTYQASQSSSSGGGGGMGGGGGGGGGGSW